MAFQVNRKKFNFEGNAYLVDVWHENKKYNAFAQQIDVDEYRVEYAEGFPNESIAEFSVLTAISKKFM